MYTMPRPFWVFLVLMFSLGLIFNTFALFTVGAILTMVLMFVDVAGLLYLTWMHKNGRVD